jgi:hypothetical protein
LGVIMVVKAATSPVFLFAGMNIITRSEGS